MIRSLQMQRNNACEKPNASPQQGFTIIEIMIVLAIVGLIMLIVFLAVPALQRNARNTQYRSDASALLAAALEWSRNHSNDPPTASGTNNGQDIVGLTKVKSITNLTIVSGPGSRTPTFNTALLNTGTKCPPSLGGSSVTTSSASTRAATMIYAVEDSNGDVVAQCTESS